MLKSLFRLSLMAGVLWWCAFATSEHDLRAADSGERSDEVVPKTVNVIVINIDPVLKTRGGVKLHAAMKWSDPWQLTDKMINDARSASHGYVNYRVVEKIEYDGFTTFRNGFTYTEETFLAMWEKDRSKADKGMTSFQWLFKKFDLAEKIKH